MVSTMNQPAKPASEVAVADMRISLPRSLRHARLAPSRGSEPLLTHGDAPGQFLAAENDAPSRHRIPPPRPRVPRPALRPRRRPAARRPHDGARATVLGARGRRRSRLPARQHRRVAERADLPDPPSRRRSPPPAGRAGERPAGAVPERRVPAGGEGHAALPVAALRPHRPPWAPLDARLRALRTRAAAHPRLRPRVAPAGAPVRLPGRGGGGPLHAERLPGRPARREDLHRRREPDPPDAGARRLRPCDPLEPPP